MWLLCARLSPQRDRLRRRQAKTSRQGDGGLRLLWHQRRHRLRCVRSGLSAIEPARVRACRRAVRARSALQGGLRGLPSYRRGACACAGDHGASAGRGGSDRHAALGVRARRDRRCGGLRAGSGTARATDAQARHQRRGADDERGFLVHLLPEQPRARRRRAPRRREGRLRRRSLPDHAGPEDADWSTPRISSTAARRTSTSSDRASS